MFVSILLILSVIVAAIGLVTYKLNEKAPCEHEWEESENSVKCTKCNRVIRKTKDPIYE